ncbi:transposase [Allokutzneria oryzae]|uniref:Transposase n=1 Tax=Allokutzneria oryzae TaxID=1378989 RepID=A0ABV6A7G0_9PSEU
MFAEIGDDRARFADARALKTFAGASPVTKESGNSESVAFRRVKNDRLAVRRTSNANETAATGTPPRCATCSTSCSIAASKSDSSTTRRWRFPTPSIGRKPPLRDIYG